MKYIALFFFLIIAFLFRSWFSFGVTAGGDLPYYFPSMMHNIVFLSTWDVRNMGMGSSMLPTLWVELYVSATLRALSFLTWETYVRLVWFFPYLALSAVSVYFLSKFYFKNKILNIFSPFLYISNTYALLLVGGGQMGVALSYALAPFGVIAFENFLKKLTLQSTIIFSLVIFVVSVMDIRIGYVLILILIIRFLFELLLLTKEKVKKYFFFFPLSIVIVLGLHAFWLLPTLFTHGAALRQFGNVYTSLGAVKFFSFAKFEDAFGILHPNWPENIFGLTHFMRPEFLLLPIMAYASLLFIGRKTEKSERTSVLFLSLTGLVGTFLAKGANDPFGGMYLWMFNHIPGFIMFRDPTKWYLLIILSYAILIPYSVGKICEWLQRKFVLRKYISKAFVLLVIAYLLFLIRPGFFGELGGTFKSHTIPSDNVKLANYLESQEKFSRTLWIPSVQRFGFSSYSHPAVSAEGFFPTATIPGSIKFLQSPQAEELLRESAIRYVVVPYDSEGEIFLKDRKYNQKLYQQTVSDVRAIAWLHEISEFGKNHVFEVANPQNHFWMYNSQGVVEYAFKNPTEYCVKVSNVAKGDVLVFSENYDQYWMAILDGKTQVGSREFHGKFNSFVLPRSGTYTLTIFYQPQKWVDIGLWISGITVLGVLACLVWFWKVNMLK